MRQNADYSIDHQSQMTSSAPSKNFLFTHPRLFLIFHHHRRKKNEDDFTMAHHSESFDDFNFYDFPSCAFLRLNLFLTALMSLVVVQFSMVVVGNNCKAMQINGS